LVAAGLSFAAVLLACVTTAGAQDRTYTIVDYPVNEQDTVNPGQDMISGTIITDGSLGTLSASNVVGGNLTIACPAGTVTDPLAEALPNSFTFAFSATQSELLLPDGYGILLIYSTATAEEDFEPNAYLNYGRFGPTDSFFVGGYQVETPQGTITALAQFVNVPPVPGPGSIAANDPWVIATAQSVPEPSTITLLGSALFGLGFVYLRRRRARA
jgi:hypothetical protein